MGLIGWIWEQWFRVRDDRIEFNKALLYVHAVERKDKEAAERLASGVRVPFRKRNQDKLRIALDLVHRRVRDEGPYASDASNGGCYRTMTDDEFAGSAQEQKAVDRYEALVQR